MPDDGIQVNERCYGLYLPSYTPEHMTSPVPGSLAVVPGKAAADYACKPVDGDGPVAYFMPDEPLQATVLTSSLYRIANWRLFRSRTEALAARSVLIRRAVDRYKAEIRALESVQ